MAELLLELLSEEIPAGMQARAADALKRLVTERLDAAGLTYGEADSSFTPRRLILVVDGLPQRQPDVTEEKKGPKVGAPEQAIQGFLRANDLASVEAAEVRETPKGSFYFSVRKIEGRATAEVLPDIIIEAVHKVPWPKSMRWGTTTSRWVRPLWSVIALFDAVPLKAALLFDEADAARAEAGGDPNIFWFGKRTTGHRFMAPELFEVSSFADYRDKLRAAKVMIDPAERRAVIVERAAQLTAAEGLTLKDDPGLLDEVVGLVEWPVVLIGGIDQAYMDLPPEVLTIAMRSHQRYFATLDAEGRLAQRFIVVANMETADAGKTIVAGNERVLRARLADARFFWDQDRKATLASRAPALKAIVFHAKLGTLDDKTKRIEALAVEIAKEIPGAEAERVRAAARLAKADLTTEMVGEFPELQGVMGRYYALNDGEHTETAEAIAEHYSPLGPGDRCPSAPVSVAVALAEKIDSLVGFWLIDEKPTGSKDPYALRRAALGVIRLIVENRLRLSLFGAFGFANQHYPERIRVQTGPSSVKSQPDIGDVSFDLLRFFTDRLKVHLRSRGVRHDLISAVFAVNRPDGGPEDDLVRLLEKVAALEEFLASDDGANLLVAYRRAANIVRIEAKKDKTNYRVDALDRSRFTQDEEKALLAALGKATAAAFVALEGEDFTGAMKALAGLRRPVDDFFDQVTVNCEDQGLRQNRLRLLDGIDDTLGRVADFSQIEG